ncbi:GlxA family transcriptional regulator [Pacificoceanicola onchidii]|uniref:GlxA family transcriptional regulator n=1 Tax=Pacificoceanicola onchidii TaxID=2562685 RepID=UPI0010A359D9|nr:GlxA family transcriptional regulator [Pacificoceanicola onchidii]
MGRPEISIDAGEANLVAVERFFFLLLPGFSALDLGAGLDSLAAANVARGEAGFTWQIVSETGDPVAASTCMTVEVEGGLPDLRCRDCVVLCAPLIEVQVASAVLKAWLRRAMRFGAQICALGGGAAVLAQTGLGQDQKLSAHWKLQPALAEMFPDLEAVCSVFEEDSAVATCGGGAATLDLFSALIGRKHGSAIASQVADQLLYASVRDRNDRQTRSDLCRLGTRHEKLGQAIRLIQDGLEETLSPSLIAGQVGLSTRQLERLFQRYLGTSPKIHMTTLRLDKARLLLQQTQMRVVDVAVACGFSSPGHFSKLYRSHFGISPHFEHGAI